MKNLNEYLEQARKLSDTKKIIILAIIVALVASVLMIFWINSTKQRIIRIGESIKDLKFSAEEIISTTEAITPSDQQIIK